MVVTPADRELWRTEVTPGGLYTKPIGANLVRGYYDNAGNFFALKANGDNLDAYMSSNKKSTVAQLVHQPFVKKDVVDKNNLTQQTTEQLPGLIKDSYIDINSKEGQMIMNGIWGTQATKAAETVSDGSSSSGSSSSFGF